ncbi:MAG: YebC/PmpR family DNA-binding transcriptional regulator [Nitrospirota bacterium]
MAGHSKWAQIKHKKAHTDAKRGKAFTKIVKEISVAARIGGGDPGGNPRLRTAIEKAKEANMPSDNVKKAIMKGTGELPGTTYEEGMYEGYGPGGAAILIEVLTDNKNRTVSEIRHILSKNGGNLGEAGCVAWMFEKKGYIIVEKTRADEDTLMSLVLDAGAEDLRNDPKEDNYEIITSPDALDAVKEAVVKGGIPVSLAEVTMLPKSYVPLEGQASEQMVRLIDALEDNDDVQNVYSNFDIADESVALQK